MRLGSVIAVSMALALALAGASGSAPGDTTLVSRSTEAVQGNGRSELQTNGVSAHGAVSADGRYVAFQSSADNLVPGDTNQATDVFVHDRVTGTTERVSVGTGGIQSNDFASSIDPSISGDGRYVAFRSAASNWFPEGDQVNDVFVHDRLTGTTQHVCCAGIPPQDGPADMPAISADGRYVAFQTSAALDPGDTAPGSTDIYVWERATGTVVDWASTGTTAGSGAFNAAVSAGGRHVAFQTTNALVPEDTNGAWDIYVRDRETQTTELVSFDASGGPVDPFTTSRWPAISADGRYVAYDSNASDIVTPDVNPSFDVYVRDRLAGTTERVNLTSDGTQVVGHAGTPSISADGRFVAFDTSGQLANSDTDGVFDVYVRDRATGTTRHASVRSDGSNDGLHGVEPAAISADGSVVAFDTVGVLVDGDANGDLDVFVHELPQAAEPPPPSAARIVYVRDNDIWSMNPDGTDQRPLRQTSFNEVNPASSPDGTKIAFKSDESAAPRIWVMDADGGNARQLSTGPAGSIDAQPTWSPDGTQIAFETSGRNPCVEIWVMNADGTDPQALVSRCPASNVLAPDWSPRGDLIAYELPNRSQTIGVARTSDGGGERIVSDVAGGARSPSWSPDGTQLAFRGVGAGGVSDIYVVGADGSGQRNVTNDAASDFEPAWSPDGGRIAYAVLSCQSEIYAVNVDGTGKANLTANDPAASEREPDWLPTAAVPPPAGPCITVSAGVDLGTLPFSAPSAPSSGAAAVQVESCSQHSQQLVVRGDDAAAAGAAWTLAATTDPCTAGVNLFGLRLESESGTAVSLTTTDQPPPLPEGGLPARATAIYDLALLMPCGGSSGSGQTLTTHVTFTATS